MNIRVRVTQTYYVICVWMYDRDQCNGIWFDLIPSAIRYGPTLLLLNRIG